MYLSQQTIRIERLLSFIVRRKYIPKRVPVICARRWEGLNLELLQVNCVLLGSVADGQDVIKSFLL